MWGCTANISALVPVGLLDRHQHDANNTETGTNHYGHAHGTTCNCMICHLVADNRNALLQAVVEITNGILRDARVFHADQAWFEQFNLQCMFRHRPMMVHASFSLIQYTWNTGAMAVGKTKVQRKCKGKLLSSFVPKVGTLCAQLFP